jgi:ATP-dependent helicase/nuclease subunit A
MEVSRDEVRVMTVHGAKGLEAPVIFLMDTTASPTDAPRLSLIRLPQAAHAANDAGCVVWAGKKADDPPVVAEARLAMIAEIEDEYRRLLYVAMTRAAERLIIGGAMPGNRKEPRKEWWYQLITTRLGDAEFVRQEIETPHGPVLRYSRADDVTPPTKTAQLSLELPEGIAVPAWLRMPVADSVPPETIMRPSDLASSTPAVFFRGNPEERQRALKRGTMVHRLLQSLPGIAVERRRHSGQGYLQRNAGDWSEEEREALLARALALIEDRQFAALFGPGSRAEVPIVGRLARPGRPPLLVSGQIDRLVVSPAEILIADYKTNLAPPETAADIPPAYLRQMALYRAVLGALYPGRAIKAVLIWTETPEIMTIPAPMLDKTLGQIISP